MKCVSSIVSPRSGQVELRLTLAHPRAASSAATEEQTKVAVILKPNRKRNAAEDQFSNYANAWSTISFSDIIFPIGVVSWYSAAASGRLFDYWVFTFGRFTCQSGFGSLE